MDKQWKQQEKVRPGNVATIGTESIIETTKRHFFTEKAKEHVDGSFIARHS